ncbi:methylated-DNA--[protein]-cysteine S-methyltransferase [Arsenicibacter rosenii]|uniref:Methylated-DNA--protein-cysteine methyltransferase n=1 Tax=Arsenicibacter rosenii TaxID=1750698 RepID=A0A1S2VRK8_9BACT|nr:methylated-DNA--[protein]-cysteine S-methyltransferase [Arsenicibacter rosenii]OIN60955.1 cysteine methyltransferase [Arsenicibacter rosenii]
MKQPTFLTAFRSPLGTVRIAGDEHGVSAISCQDQDNPDALPEPQALLPAPVWEAATQLQAYFAGQRQSFDFRMNPQGTAFQQRVWQLLLTVPYGQTRSYLSLSRELGDEKAIRAVAAANGKNPLWIVVPCHRIIGSDGKLVGYAGGLWRKKWLLEHEQNQRQMTLF